MTSPIAAAVLSLVGAAGLAQEVYVTGYAARKVYHVSGGRLLRSIPMPGNPFDTVLSADGRFLYVSQPRLGAVSVISTADDSIVARIAIPGSPAKMAVGNADTRLYVASNTRVPPHVVVVDIGARGAARSNTVAGSIDLSPHGAFSAFAVAAFGELLAVGTHSGHILLYDTSGASPKLLQKRETGVRVNHLIFSPAGMKIYALLAVPQSTVDENGAVTPAGNLHVLRSESLAVMKVLSAGPSELKSAATLNEAFLYLTDVRGMLHVLDIGTDRILESFPAGKQLSGITAAGGRLYVVDTARHVLETIVPAARYENDRIAGSIVLDGNSAPVALAVRRVGSKAPCPAPPGSDSRCSHTAPGP